MLTTLTAVSVEAPAREWGARSASLALHAGLIALAVWWTQADPVAPPEPRVLFDTIIWGAPPDRPPVPVDRATGPAWPGPLVVPGVVDVPAIDVPTNPAWMSVAPDGPPAISDPQVPGSAIGPSAPAGAPIDEHVVEEAPVLLTHPRPRYPEILRQAGIEGRVMVEAVIDTSGRAERGSIRVLNATHPLFGADAEALVLGSRYRPGRMSDRPVRVRIVVPVVFALRR